MHAGEGMRQRRQEDVFPRHVAGGFRGNRHDPDRVRADRGEREVAEREDARVADEDVERDDKDEVDQRRRRHLLQHCGSRCGERQG